MDYSIIISAACPSGRSAVMSYRLLGRKNPSLRGLTGWREVP